MHESFHVVILPVHYLQGSEMVKPERGKSVKQTFTWQNGCDAS